MFEETPIYAFWSETITRSADPRTFALPDPEPGPSTRPNPFEILSRETAGGNVDKDSLEETEVEGSDDSERLEVEPEKMWMTDAECPGFDIGAIYVYICHQCSNEVSDLLVEELQMEDPFS